MYKEKTTIHKNAEENDTGNEFMVAPPKLKTAFVLGKKIWILRENADG